MSIRSDFIVFANLVRAEVARRRARRPWAAHVRERGPIPAGKIEALLYFGDDPINLYQVRQWYRPLEKLAESRPVAILARDIRCANIIRAETSLHVLWMPQVGLIENFVAKQRVGVVFYVNQNMLNFRMMRFRAPAHVFLSHGESDKDYMASNQLKAYDYTFVAGEAARDRLHGKLIGFDVEARTLPIGRPQLDAPPPAPLALPTDDRIVVLYAPTWEGDRPSMSYSSVATHGVAMVSQLVASGRHRVIYRPHPRTGVVDREHRHAHQRLVELLTSANRADPRAQHVVDTESEFGWQLASADACIADISAVAYDWLATGKPLVLTEPASEAALLDEGGVASALVSLTAAEASGVIEALDRADEPAHAQRRAELVEYYFGSVEPGASMERWLAVSDGVIASRVAALSD